MVITLLWYDNRCLVIYNGKIDVAPVSLGTKFEKCKYLLGNNAMRGTE